MLRGGRLSVPDALSCAAAPLTSFPSAAQARQDGSVKVV
jgi:hypothetical protein